MAIYKIDEMNDGASKGNPNADIKTAVGEFMKVAIMTKPDAEGPPLHEHPNEEQWTLVLKGQMHFIVGDQDEIVGPGHLIHIPRNTPHRSRPVNGPATFFTVKSPPGNGKMDQDYNKHSDAEAAEGKYPGTKK